MNRIMEERIVELTSRLCDGGFESPDELAELESFLASSDEARNLYSQVVEIHGRLHRDAATSENFHKKRVAARRAQGTAVRQYSPRTLLAIATAATALGVILLYSSSTETTHEKIGQAPTSIAKVVQKIDCNWESERWGTADSSELAIGQVLNLDSGVMVVEFGCGALLTLEGPAQLKVESERRAFLFSGRLTAEVPKSGRGFTVGTPAGEAIDLGTNFGLAVDGDGAVETHVFDGEVVLRKKPPNESSLPVEFSLTSEMAKRIYADSELVEEFKAEPRQFARLASYDIGDIGQQFLRLEQVQVPQSKKIAFWLDAGALLQLDEKEKVIAWSDRTQRSVSGNRAAWQVRKEARPRWKPAAINGKPAVQFDGKTGLMTTPFKTGNEVTVAVTAISKPAAEGEGVGMIINFNGPPNMVLERHASGMLQGRMYAGFVEGKYTHGAFLSGGKLLNEVPFVGLFVYSYQKNRSSLWLDGKLVAQGEASAAAEIHSPRFIGRHREGWKDFFVGEVGELIVFDAALTDEDCQRLTHVLMEKYSLIASNE